MTDAFRTALGRPPRGARASVLVASVVAIVLAGIYLLAPLMGGDLSAQIAHADFARTHPFTPVDLRWFGGVLPFAYSLWTPAFMGILGVRSTGVVATVIAVALFTLVLRQAGARRTILGGVAAAVTFTSSLAEGRVTFACGLAAGLGAIAVLGRRPSSPRGRWAAALLAVLAGTASPVVAVFLLVGTGALGLRHRFADAAALAASALPLGVTAWYFGEGGRQVFGAHDAVRAVLATALVIAVVPSRRRVVRVGAGIALIMVVLAVVVPTPLGSNSARLSLLFAIPLVAALVEFRVITLVAVLGLAVIVQTPVTFGTLAGAGRPVTRPSYFLPLERELRSQGRSGRVEVPELTGHWDAAYLARRVPLARGWLRQTDTKLNDDVFYRHLPTAATYRGFLDRNAVQFVAVAGARATFYGRREVALIKGGLDYLRAVWSDADWTLYAVSAPTPIVSAPAALIAYRADRVILRAPADTEVTVRLRWFDWLTVTAPSGRACLQPGNDGVRLRTGPAGVYEITSSLTRRTPRC